MEKYVSYIFMIVGYISLNNKHTGVKLFVDYGGLTFLSKTFDEKSLEKWTGTI